MALPASSPVALPPRYYRDNFLALRDTVLQRYADLLSPDEHAWLARFDALPDTAQCLYLRLVSRVGPWFRLRKLDYPEIGDTGAPAARLLDDGFLQEAAGLELAELGRLFTRGELRQAFPAALDGVAGGKAADLAAIGEWAEREEIDAGRLQSMACDLGANPERLVGPTGLDIVALLQLLYFGNRRQSLTEFVLSDLGVATYYPYSLDRAQRLFPDREAVDDYRDCGVLADAYASLREAGDDAAIADLAEGLLTVPVRHPASERRWWRLFNRVARHLERSGRYEAALALYRRSELHPARERAARVLEQLGRWEEAIELCHAILASPAGEEEREAARRILPRVQRRAGQPVQARPRDSFPRLDLCLARGELRVEVAAAHALAARWPQVHYVENTLVNGLFGLAFWEQIFSPVAGAFHNPFQAVPADMFDGSFLHRRRHMLEDRLAILEKASLVEELLAAYRRFEGMQCRWVHWRALSPELVADALRCIPRAHLLSMWRRLLFDPAENRRGFPDLLALGRSSGEYCMIEVKGPGDALQDSQKRWLRFFAEENIPAAVAWVTWQGE